MRKLILQEWISLDGFAADAQGTTSFMESADLNKESDADMLHALGSIGLILLGATTYKMFAGFWPTGQSKDEVVANKINALPKAVFSSALKSAPWGDYDPVKIIHADAVAEVKKLKAQPGKDIVIWGSISVAQSLMEAGLIDVYEIRVCPVILGKGRPLFSTKGIKLELLETKQYKSGLVMLKYMPSGK